MEKEGIEIHERTIGKILKKENLVRKYRVRKIKYKYIKAERQPGELVEIDVKYVPGTIKDKRYFQYTAIDTASRWRYLSVYEEQTNFHSILFLKEVMKKFEPTSKFHIELPDDEKHHQTFQETTNRYYCLSIRRILVNNNVNKTKTSLLKMALNAIFNRGWSSAVFSRRLRLDKQMSSFLLENDCPFSLLAKLQTYDFCEGSGRFFRISWPLLVIFALDQSKKSVVYR